MNGFIFFDERNWISDCGLLIAVGVLAVGLVILVLWMLLLFYTRQGWKVRCRATGKEGKGDQSGLLQFWVTYKSESN